MNPPFKFRHFPGVPRAPPAFVDPHPQPAEGSQSPTVEDSTDIPPAKKHGIHGGFLFDTSNTKSTTVGFRPFQKTLKIWDLHEPSTKSHL